MGFFIGPHALFPSLHTIVPCLYNLLASLYMTEYVFKHIITVYILIMYNKPCGFCHLFILKLQDTVSSEFFYILNIIIIQCESQRDKSNVFLLILFPYVNVSNCINLFVPAHFNIVNIKIVECKVPFTTDIAVFEAL